jgi:hypothetical protein
MFHPPEGFCMRSYSSSVISFSGSALDLGLVIALSGCAGVKMTTDLVDAQAASLQCEITSLSRVNINNGSYYQVFELNLQQGDLIRVRQSGALQDATLTLLDERGQLINGPRQGACTLHPTPAVGIDWVSVAAPKMVTAPLP